MSRQEQPYNAIIDDLYQGSFDEQAWDHDLARLASGDVLLRMSHGMTSYDRASP